MKLSIIIITPLSLLLVFLLLSNQGAPIVYAQPTGWVELIGERTRTGKSFYDPSRPGVVLFKGSVARVHYDGPDWKDIDNTLVPSLANVPTLGLADLEMTTDDYEFYALQTLNTIPLWFYRNKSVSDTYITFNPQALQWTNDLDQIDLISMPQSMIGTVTDNRLHWEDAYGPGINLTLSAQAGRLAKALTLESMPRAPAQYILDGENPALELQFIFGTPSGPDAPEIWIDGVLWGQSARTETIGAVEFRKNGETLFSFAEPTAFDSGFGIANPSLVFTKQGPNLVAIRVPLNFLENAVYPVIIDPTTSDSVTLGADDGWNNGGVGLNTVATFVDVGAFSGVQRDTFARFQTVNIPNGVTISAANITFEMDACGALCGSQKTNIYMNDIDDAVSPTTGAGMEALDRTTSFTSYDDFTPSLDVPTTTPDIASVVEEVTSRPGWVANNDLMLLWDDNATPGDDFAQMDSFESGDPFILAIEYIAWENTAPTITNKISTETVDSNVSYNRSFSATDPDTNQTLQWELNATDTPFTITVWNGGNRTTYVTADPDETGTFYVNVTVGDDALGPSGNETDYVNYTLIIQEPTLVQPETLLENALFFLVGFIPFLMAIGIGFWKEQGSMLFIGGLIGILLGLWVMVTVYWVFGFSFVGISILFMYIGWVNRDYMG